MRPPPPPWSVAGWSGVQMTAWDLGAAVGSIPSPAEWSGGHTFDIQRAGELVIVRDTHTFGVRSWCEYSGESFFSRPLEGIGPACILLSEVLLPVKLPVGLVHKGGAVGKVGGKVRGGNFFTSGFSPLFSCHLAFYQTYIGSSHSSN